MLAVQPESRLDRQRDLIPTEKLKEQHVFVIGVGAIGRQVALQLAALGVAKMTLFDPDTVEITNTATQGYSILDIGVPKVSSTGGEICWSLQEEVQTEEVKDVFRPSQHDAEGKAVFCCVDTIQARKAIWEGVKNKCQFWCDARMLGETMHVFATQANMENHQHYQESLFEPEEAVTGSCTSRGVIYTASIAAGLMLHQFSRYLRGMRLDPQVSLTLLASEMHVSGEAKQLPF